MKVSDVLFASRFTAKMRSGTRPTVPEGPGDIFWKSSTTTLSVANDAGDTWIEYDFSNISANSVANGGTGFSAFSTGDLMVGNAGTTLSKLGVSGASNGYVLTYDSAQSLKMKWAASGGGGGTAGAMMIEFDDSQTIPNSTTTSLTYSASFGSLASNFDLTGSPSITVTSASAGTYLVQINVVIDGLPTFSGDFDLWIRKNGSKVNAMKMPYVYTTFAHGDLLRPMIPAFYLSLSNGDVLDIQVTQDTGSSVTTANTVVKGLSVITFTQVT